MLLHTKQYHLCNQSLMETVNEYCWMKNCSLVDKSCRPRKPLYLWDFPGKNIGVGCHFLFQGIFLTHGSKPGLLLGRWILYHWATWEAQVKNSGFQLPHHQVTQSSHTPAMPSYSEHEPWGLEGGGVASRDLAVGVISLSQTVVGILGNFLFIRMLPFTSGDTG